MKSFRDYMNLREEDEDNVAPLNPTETGDMSRINRISQMAWKNHNSEVRALFKKLAARDPEIASEYDSLSDSDQEVDKNKGRKSMSGKDEIIPADADSNMSNPIY